MTDTSWITPDIAAHARHLQELGKQITALDWGAFTDRCEEAGADENTVQHLRHHQKGSHKWPNDCGALSRIVRAAR